MVAVKLWEKFIKIPVDKLINVWNIFCSVCHDSNRLLKGLKDKSVHIKVYIYKTS